MHDCWLNVLRRLVQSWKAGPPDQAYHLPLTGSKFQSFANLCRVYHSSCPLSLTPTPHLLHHVP
jgi:hypothetical protein